MTNRQRLLKTFKREKIDRVLWQPRIGYWYEGRKLDGTLPERFTGMSKLEVYDELESAPRYLWEVLPIPLFRLEKDATIKYREEKKDDLVTCIHDTPAGELKEVRRIAEHGAGWHPIKYPIVNPDDMKVMAYVLEHTKFVFDESDFRKGDEALGDRGVVQCFFMRSPFQRLLIEYMGLENTIYALMDYPSETDDLMKAIETSDDAMYDILAKSPMEIINFGENIDANLDAPRYFEKYLIPYYKKRVKQLRDAGIFTHLHMDGSLKPLLPLMNESGFDGIEAATPIPQGDITIEELKEAMGDTILLDGIPALLFLPEFPEKDLIECTEKLLELFAPNLILGVSDELPPPADIDRFKLVLDIIKDYKLD